MAAMLVSCLLVYTAKAEDASEAEIMKALAAQPDHGIKGAGASKMSSPDDEALVERLRKKSLVSLSMGERAQLDMAIAKKPKIDLEMDFDYKSDVLRGKSLELAEKLGRVLSSAPMSNETFLLAGHTDAKGSALTNQDLSRRRAESVRRFLIERYGIAADRLICIGYGKERLKNPENPLGRENRRVQTVNMMVSRSAENKQ